MSQAVQWIDAHCHLDLLADFEDEARRRQELGLWTLAVTTLPEAWPRNRQVASRYSMVEAGLGIHPELVAQYPGAISTWMGLAEEARFIGEVGLDGRRQNRASLAEQREVFATILDLCTKQGGKVLTVHSAGAQEEVVALLEDRLDFERNRVVLHWFTGSLELYRRAAELGCFFSVNAAMLAGARLVKQVQEIPEGRLLTESDAPFLAKRFGRRSNVEQTTEALASVLEVSVTTLASELQTNLKGLLEKVR